MKDFMADLKKQSEKEFELDVTMSSLELISNVDDATRITYELSKFLGDEQTGAAILAMLNIIVVSCGGSRKPGVAIESVRRLLLAGFNEMMSRHPELGAEVNEADRG